MIEKILSYRSELSGSVDFQKYPVNLICGEAEGHTIRCAVTENGDPVADNASCTVKLLRADGNTVVIRGSFENGIASVTLPQACYAAEGPYKLTMSLVKGEQVSVVLVLIGYVKKYDSDAIVDPSHMIPTLDELLAQIEHLEEVTAEAQEVVDDAKPEISRLSESVSEIKNGLINGCGELSFTWVSGSFNPTTGKETTSSGTWLRNTEFIKAANDRFELNQADNIRSVVYEYEKPDLDTYIAGAQAKAHDGNSVVDVVKGHFYRICSRINGETGITPEMCPAVKVDFPIKKADDLADEVKALREEMEALISGNILAGKTVYAVGDSITYGANNSAVSYITKIADRNNMSLTNLAVSGSTWVLTPKTSGSTPADSGTQYRGLIPDRVTQMLALSEPDYVILSGGFNDAQRSVVNAVGTVTVPNSASQNYSCYQDSFDTNTFAGAIEHAVYQIKQGFPNAKLLYVITYRKTYEFNWEMTYAPVIRQICEKWAIPYVDFTREGNMICNSNLASSTSIFTDGTHPNDEGYQRMSVLVENRLREV